MTTTAGRATRPDTTKAVANLIQWLETGLAPDGMMAEECFADLAVPHWRVQAASGAELLDLRRSIHPFPGRVRVERIDRTDLGFTIEFEERWEDGGQRWYCREMIRADVADDRIIDLAVYCTGDWDEALQRRHAREVTLLRP